MVTYEFYTETYKGQTVPPSFFDIYSRQAERYVDKCLKVYTVYNSQEEIDSRKDYCICEITDSLYVYQTTLGNGIIQEKDGGASVTYNSESTTNNAQMLNIFGSYFDYYRGG